MDDNGTRIENHDMMCDIVKDYFTSVFTRPHNTEAMQYIDEGRHVIADQNNTLVANVTFEEFSLGIKQMHPDKDVSIERTKSNIFSTVLIHCRR